MNRAELAWFAFGVVFALVILFGFGRWFITL